MIQEKGRSSLGKAQKVNYSENLSCFLRLS